MDEMYEQDRLESERATTPPDAEVLPETGSGADRFPGGDEPASSGFSWRIPGSTPAVMHSQGGIPNEFDHLFRDSDEDGRRSLMPSQGPIGVVMPAIGPGRSFAALPPGPEQQGQQGAPGQGRPQGQQGYGQQGESQLPAYQPADQQLGAYPQQPTYQQAAYQPTTQVPIGAPSDDDQNTQAIPRVPVQPYVYGTAENAQPVAGAQDPSAARRSSQVTMAIAGGVFVVLIVLVAMMFTGGKNNTKTTGNPGAAGTPTGEASKSAPVGKAQADAIYSLMTQGTSARDAATGAISNVSTCQKQTDAQATFIAAAKTRQGQADQILTLPIDQLSAEAKQLVQDLHSAWQYSADSESELAAWATDNLTCTGKPTSTGNYSKSTSYGSKAGSLKATAAREWNAMAASLGESTIGASAL